MAKQHKYDAIPQNLKTEFSSIVCQMSPENLSCDGEASVHYQRNRYADLLADWRVLEKKAGLSVDVDDFEDYMYEYM